MLFRKRITMAMDRLYGCTSWSMILLFPYIKKFFTHCGSYAFGFKTGVYPFKTNFKNLDVSDKTVLNDNDPYKS